LHFTNVIRVIKPKMRWVGACSMREISTYQILVRKPEGKRPLRTPRHSWEDNTGMDLRETGKVWT